MSELPTIAIIGGGFSGTLTAIHLLRSEVPSRVVLIQRGPDLARGVAYSTSSLAHLLNVPAARMSALPDDPEHFLRWSREHIHPATPPDAFLPRRRYGDYLAQLFAEAARGKGADRFEVIQDSAIDIEPGSPATLRLSSSRSITAQQIVVARGHSPARPPAVAFGEAFYASPRFIASPWTPGALDAIKPGDDVLILGTGLTMYDVVLSLRERGHTATIHAISRRGLLPRPHAAQPLGLTGAPAADTWLAVEPTAKAQLSRLRDVANQCDWRAAVDSIRPVTQKLWQRLPQKERERFAARLRPFWEVHRHRAAISVHDAIHQLITSGSLRVRAVRMRGWTEHTDGVTADLGDASLTVRHVINCTGPDSDVSRSADPLVKALLRRGLIVGDPLGYGVETAADGAIIDAGGTPSNWLYTLGTWRKPGLWESVAVPELRVQARDLAATLTATLLAAR